MVLTGCHKKETPASQPVSQATQTTPAAQTTTQNSPSPITETITVEKTYEGILPCADCSGVKTRLKLNSNPNDPNNNTYELTQTYMGKEPNNTFVTTGKYSVQNSPENNSMIYIFTPDDADDEQIYYAVYNTDPTTMHALDQDMKKIKSDINHILKLVN